MKIKVIGFKVGESRPTANKTVDISWFMNREKVLQKVGEIIYEVLEKSDFISIRILKR